ncbi:MAG: hypothetical protein V3T05_14470 [Myxococcota bacterium]
MAELPSAPHVARRLADALEAADIPYAVGGAIAYGLHAPPRATNDVDLNVFVEPTSIRPVLKILTDAGATCDFDEAAASAVERGDFIVWFDGMRVDVFVLSIPLSNEAAKRAQRATLLGRPITVLSAEDLALFKLLFFRSKDVADVQRMVAFQGKALDRNYIRTWLVRMVDDDDPRVEQWDAIVAAADRQA